MPFKSLCGLAKATIALLPLFACISLAQSSSPSTSTCYDAHDPRDIRLSDVQAPGAVVNNPCTDIPFLRLFKPTAAASESTDIAAIVMPGGGHNELIDTNEQSPVGRYFADRLGITTSVLYYRLVQPTGTYRYPVPMWDTQRATSVSMPRSS